MMKTSDVMKCLQTSPNIRKVSFSLFCTKLSLLVFLIAIGC